MLQSPWYEKCYGDCLKEKTHLPLCGGIATPEISVGYSVVLDFGRFFGKTRIDVL
jgi:hypothetical protein